MVNRSLLSHQKISLASHPKCWTAVFLHIQNVWTKVYLSTQNVLNKSFFFAPKMLNKGPPSHLNRLTSHPNWSTQVLLRIQDVWTKVLLHTQIVKQQSSFTYIKFEQEFSFTPKMWRTKVLLPPQMINKSFHRIQNVRTKVLINILTQTVNKSLPLHPNFFEQESCFASKLVNRSLPSHPKCLTTVFLHIQNVWTKVLFHVHNICN